MKLQGKIAILIGLIALISSCQKGEMPSPNSCNSHQEGVNARTGDPSRDDESTTGGSGINTDGTAVTDSVGIVGGGDGDRDGGGIVGGGDGDRDGGGGIIGGGDGDRDGEGGGRMMNPEQPK